ncbi:MAG TPA: radical SAM protein, partial [Candidatus Aminicenantes bacterium]|nr:radical SAM protein [Candidatus Aminicenantes bacterium]
MIVGSCIPGMAGERLRDVFSGRTITPTDFSALDELPGIRLRSDNLPAIWGRAAAVRLPPRPGFLSGLAMRLDDLALDWRRFWTGRRPGHWKRRKVPLPKRRNTIAFSIVAGCSRRCAYCAKPFASGHIRSKPLETVIETIRGGLALGFRRFDLFADSIGLYGLDLHTPLGDLLERLLKLKRRFSVGLFDLHPQDFLKHFDAIRQLARAGKLHYLHVPIQSGNEDIL